jgi:AraC-like DNA-binding protein
LNLVIRGRARFGVGERTVTVSPGELLVFPAGQDHVLLEGSQDLYLYAVGLDPAYSTDVLGAAREAVVPLHARLAPAEFERVAAGAGAIVDRVDAAQAVAELWERLHWLGRHSGERSGRGAHVLTRRALKAMAEEPELGLGALAAEVRTQPSEVSRHFHRDVGTTLVRHRTRIRLLNLIRLVDAGKSLMGAAGDAGFGSYAQCHRSFCAELGCGPKQFFFSGLRERMQQAYEP